MSKAFTMWSGGKDSHYALYRALQAGLECDLLVTFIDAETELVLLHRTPPELIEEQSRLIGIPLLKVRATPQTYERELRNILFELRCDGITHGIFGDIGGRESRDWFESLLGNYDMRAVFPLWGIPPHHLIAEQRRLMKSIIIQVERKVSEIYLGREVTAEFVEYMGENGWSPSGEDGEYHTFVCRSPLMEGEIVLTHGERRATPEKVGVEIDYWKVE
jgi:diphthine-ammonia ligase